MMADGMAKNFEVITDEFFEWSHQMAEGLKRFKHAGLKFDKHNVFHLLQNLVTETFRALPRTFGYLFSISMLTRIVMEFI